MPRRAPRYDLAYWYLDFTTNQLRRSEESFRKANYPEVIDLAQDSIEFSIKAMFELAGEDYDPEHEISRSIPILNNTFRGFRREFTRAALISNRWLGTARNIPRYGDQTGGVAPRTLYPKTEVKQALSDARETFCLLLRIEKKLKLRPPTKIGLLNGYVEGSRYRETVC